MPISYPIDTQRHSAAHLMAAAVHRLFPSAKFGVGPVVENGFYYDIDIGRAFTPEDVKQIVDAMKDILKENPAFERQEMPIDEAIQLFERMGQPYKVELLNDLKTKGTTKLSEEESGDIDPTNIHTVSVYKTGDFTDLCRGPHVGHASDIGAWKLWKISGAYWRGNQDNPQMQRIYGLCFETPQALSAFERMLEEAEKRDHRKLGAELDLFAFSPLVGSGLPLFTPRGVLLRNLLTDFVWELMRPYGYERVWIPHLAKSELYKTSGHWDKFEDDLFHVSSKKSDEEFVLKPMNCPHHAQIYASRPRSYRDLPLRYSEVTTVYRDENTGQLQGLSRVRSITQDDAHVFCMADQVHTEVMGMYRIIEAFYGVFRMPLRVRLSVRDPGHPEKYLGGDESWQKAEAALADVMKQAGVSVEVGEGEAAFYGPKLDFVAKDAIGREWQLATIQVDFNQPERFGLEYAAGDGSKQRPVMVHRAILGSVERFLGILIEHYAGAFPVWLAPTQVLVIPVAERHLAFAETLAAELSAQGIRASADRSNESVGKKIRSAEKQKIPYMLVVGDKEAAGEPLTLRIRGKEEQETVEKRAFADRVKEETKGRSET
ncbi:threonine--tRNA ligase [candidate division WWE3 bacterium]|uniref:Threonine--tRNA ligase n=1 Tax=candidate division WWE3 bacterium TaxID=2053526 RepID=A0A928TU66_UNCKA|nr:threonine--tRNA ligase [candidate division WWE3 bacterium]